MSKFVLAGGTYHLPQEKPLVWSTKVSRKVWLWKISNVRNIEVKGHDIERVGN